MATIFTHAIVPLSIRAVLGRDKVPDILLFYACVATMLPDLDVIAFTFNIPYEDPFGHRGATHSIVFALLTGLLGVLFHRYLQCEKHIAFLLLSVCTISHPLFDALTNGGLGVAWFWPFSNERFFFPWRPIKVSPIGLQEFLTPRGLRVLKSEIIVVWIPFAILLLSFLIARTLLSKQGDDDPS